jgi:hypothetical protein
VSPGHTGSNPLAPGILVALLVAGCAAVAWPEDSPLVPQPGGELVGDETWAWIFLVLLALAFGVYLVGLAVLARSAASSRAVVAVAAVVQLVPLGAPLLLSSDAWTYWNYGRIAVVHGGNPYRDTPSDFPDDPAFAYSGEAWRDRTSVYAPGFTLASEPLAAAAGSSADAAAWIYKSLAALAAVAMATLAARLAARPALAAAFVGWNPLLAVHLAGGGHNDAWVGALLLAALACAGARRQWAGASWVVSASIKWIPVVLFPVHAVETPKRGRHVGYLGLALTAAVVFGLATWRYGLAWLDAFGPLAENARETTSYALPARLNQLGVPEGLAITLFGAIFVAGYALLIRAAWRGRARLALAAVLLLACAPYVAPWYLAWVVPLAAVEEDTLARGLALALTAYLLPQTIPV